MSVSAKSKVVNLFTLLVIFLTAFQGLIPAMPIGNAGVITVVSAITMFMVSTLTAWKQYLSIEITNKSLKPTIFVAILATLGALNDVFDVVHISAVTGQWVRFSITLITMFLNVASKILWPTEDTKSSL